MKTIKSSDVLDVHELISQQSIMIERQGKIISKLLLILAETINIEDFMEINKIV